MAKHPGGRPTVMTPEVLDKLVEGFTYGYTDVEASLHAGISVDALYAYCRKNEGFASRKEALKRSTTMAAKKNIYHEVGAGDVNTSKWQLELRASDEYSKQQKTDVTSGGEKITVHPVSFADYTTGEEDISST